MDNESGKFMKGNEVPRDEDQSSKLSERNRKLIPETR